MSNESLKSGSKRSSGPVHVLPPMAPDPSITSLGFRYEADIAREAHERSASNDSMLTGRQFGPYEVGEQLGQGVMGMVYRARDLNLRHDVALEILPAELTSDAPLFAKFEREVRALTTLDAPNIGAVYGIEQHEGTHALVRELVEGVTLAARLSQSSTLTAEEALDIARQIAIALDAAHGKGIVHRDLSPSSVRIAGDGTVKVVDFATTSFTGAGVRPGLGNYLAPEQRQGREADRRCDVWALGLVIYEMFAGRLPFEGGTPATLSTLTSALAALPKRVQTEMTPILARALAIDRADRYQTMSELITDLDRARERFGTHASRILTPWVRDRFAAVAPAGPDLREGQTAAEPSIVDDGDEDAAPSEPDFTASDELTEIRTSQRRLREYRAKTLQLTGVEEVVARKVLADYEARCQDLERKAAPLVQKVRNEHRRLQRSVEHVRRADEEARLMKAEADLRHAVGEIDDAELAARVREPNETRARCAERLATFETVEARFLAALETGAENDPVRTT